MSTPAPAEAVSGINNEIIASREPYYIDGISLRTHDMFCFDEREVAEAEAAAPGMTAVAPEEYIHVAGGVLNIPYNQAVLDETLKPFSVRDNFADRASEVMPVLIEVGVRPGVHSDVASEGGSQVRHTAEGPVGCGYAELRRPVSLHIVENGTSIISDAAELRPELFREPRDYNFAHAVAAAHGRLAERAGFLPKGRAVVMAATAKGAKLMLVKGRHTATEGIINLADGTTFGSDGANRAGLDAYSQGSWAVDEANDLVRDRYPYDKRQQQIAELIDTIGTMRALGVETIATRR